MGEEAKTGNDAAPEETVDETVAAAYKELENRDEGEPSRDATQSLDIPEEDGPARDPETGRFIASGSQSSTGQPSGDPDGRSKAADAVSSGQRMASSPDEGGDAAGDADQDAGGEAARGGGEQGADTDQPAADAEAARGAPVPPEHWSADDKDRFNKLPDDAKQFVMDRHNSMEADYTRRIQEIGPQREILDRYRPYFDSLGITPHEGLAKLFGAEEMLRTGSPVQRAAFYQQLGRDYGIIPPGFDWPGVYSQTPPAHQGAQPQGYGGAEQGGQDYNSDPYGAPPPGAPPAGPIQPGANGDVSARVAALEENMRREAIARQQSGTSQITAFAGETNPDGSLKHPYFDDVVADMTSLAASMNARGQRPDLETLYENACYANPTIRAKMEAARSRSGSSNSEGRGATADRQKAANARKKVASGAKTDRYEAKPQAQPDKGDEKRSVEDDVAAAYDALAAEAAARE